MVRSIEKGREQRVSLCNRGGRGQAGLREQSEQCHTALWTAQFLSHFPFLVSAFRAILNRSTSSHFVRCLIVYLAENRIPQYVHWSTQTSTFYGERAVGAKGKLFMRLN